MAAVGGLIQTALYLYLLLFFARLVAEYVILLSRSWRPSGAAAGVLEVVYSATDPPLTAVRRVLPPLRLGGIQLDLAFIVVVFVLFVLAGTVVPTVFS